MTTPWRKKRIIRSRPKANPAGVDNAGNPLLEYGDPPPSVAKAMHELLKRKGLIDQTNKDEVEADA